MTDWKIFQRLKISIFPKKPRQKNGVFKMTTGTLKTTGLNETNHSEGKVYFGGLREIERLGLLAEEFELFF